MFNPLISAMFPFLVVAGVIPQATDYTAWDKAGAVAVCLLMLGLMIALHRAGLKRVDTISDRHMAFVEAQTKVMTTLVSSNNSVIEGYNVMHRRLDGMFSCRKTGCPVRVMLAFEEVEPMHHPAPGAETPLAGPVGKLP